MTTILGCEISPELATEARAVVEGLRAGEKMPNRRIVELVYEMTRESLERQFLEPAEAIGAGSRLMKFIEMSVHGSLKAVHMGLKRVIPKLRPDQLLLVADFIERSLHEEAALAGRMPPD